ncbi:hypothetical protein CF336_g6584 [Tilletia laevis]|uniref:Inositol hexakisphosphate-domain-containing protein n=2 Tax=Tilletia TaxID=13289 RepID=A0A177UBU8_9BASI|nr:hypothetical protein CF336_g6584 [Tilletia laevis]KAE8192149.1 hypothetical protein CF335_g5910 [Tilletia laevis]KAE8255055.1 hypothetical protein A4X03_0g5621 [Tilletia caries]CAD6922391.1 unnamed protein product [Tilletia caries]
MALPDQASLVRRRTGSVLTRGLVLKSDHPNVPLPQLRPRITPSNTDIFNLQGAHNFRAAAGGLGVYGTAQPTVGGLRTILALLGCRPLASPATASSVDPIARRRSSAATATATEGSTHHYQNTCIWVCTREEPVIYVSGRPFVLREASAPTETFGLSTRASNLESIERRLRADILNEAERNGGLVLVHEEDSLAPHPSVAALAGAGKDTNNASRSNTANPPPASSSSSSSGTSTAQPSTTSPIRLTPTWIAVDETTVQTPRQVWDQIRLAGWRVSYHRIPIANEQAIENNYLDAYTELLRGCDPLTTSVVANCGVGYVRTTFAMCAALIVRRRQMMLRGNPDPLLPNTPNAGDERGRASSPQLNSNNTRSRSVDPHSLNAGGGGGGGGVARSLQLASAQQAHDVSILKLLHVLSTTPAPTPSASFTFGGAPSASVGAGGAGGRAGVQAGGGSSALHPAVLIPTLISHPPLLDALRAANAGDYGVVRQLLGLLDDNNNKPDANAEPNDSIGGTGGGVGSKDIVDWAIDSCDQVLNLREAILQERLRYAVGDSSTTPNPNSTPASSTTPSTSSTGSTAHLHRASKQLEKYLFLLAFASYVSGSLSARFEYRFADWLRDRREIWGMIGRMRGAGAAASSSSSGAGVGRMLAFFDPIADLSALVGGNAGSALGLRPAGAGSNNQQVGRFGEGTPLAGDEFAEHVVRSRAGVVLRPFMLLKNDIWFSFDDNGNNDAVDGSLESRNGGRTSSGAGVVPRTMIGPNVRGAVNFRRVGESHVFATGQPTVEGIIGAVHAVFEMLLASEGQHQQQQQKELKRITWINLREEPLVYIGSRPFCLRQSAKSLRNIKNYSGISWRRLNLLEDRLKADVLAELRMGEGSLLLHTEREGGVVEPVWEQVREEEVMTVQEVMDMVRRRFLSDDDEGEGEGEGFKIELDYRRIPITAEKPPDHSEVAHILRTVLRARVDRNPVVLNDQLGRGRSSMTACIVLLVQRWIGRHGSVDDTTADAGPMTTTTTTGRGPLSYHVINSLLRVISQGLRVKAEVDDAIDACAAVTNLRESIELARLSAEDTENERERRKWISSGIQSLRKYFELIIFQAYLDTVTPAELLEKEMAHPSENLGLSIPGHPELEDDDDNTPEIDLNPSLLSSANGAGAQQNRSRRNRDGSEVLSSFEQFVVSQPVFDTISRGFSKVDMETIMPLQKVDAGANGDGSGGAGAGTGEDGLGSAADEVEDVVQNRRGSILSAFTMLKSDFFVGIVKAGLKERIEGAPNLRGAAMILHPNAAAAGGGAGETIFTVQPATPSSSTWSMRKSESTSLGGSGGLSATGMMEGIKLETWGSGMPTVDGLRRALARMGAAPGGMADVVWTSLREEPVLYVNGRPHVLRLADQPLTNVEATGVTTEVVESMEKALKQDVLKEAAVRNGRLLLHDEVEGQRGNFEVIPIWENVGEDDVLTPREVYELVISEGYRVDYARLAITDEQAPIPDVFSHLEHRVQLALDTGAACVFNCQMGRGRTTTGMTISSLVSTVTWYGSAILHNASILDDDATAAGLTISSSAAALTDDTNNNNNVRDMIMDREDQVYLAGEYRVILQLVGVLSRGKSAKKLADKAIDRMEAVQNLRKAIYDSKLRMDSADVGTKKHKHLSIVYANYLQRYGYIITFANYLLEKAQANAEANAGAESTGTAGDADDDGTGSMVASVASLSGAWGSSSALVGAGGRGGAATWGGFGGPTAAFPTFAEWLRSRREIVSILDRTE